jgi:hypothetical protein
VFYLNLSLLFFLKMATAASLTEPAKLLLLSSILARGGVISLNGKAFLKVGTMNNALVVGPFDGEILSPTPRLHKTNG